MSLLQRVSDLEAELASKSQVVSRLNSELNELREEAVNIEDLRRSVRDLQKQIDLAKDSDDATQRKNAELRQTLKNKENQLEVGNFNRRFFLQRLSVHVIK